jgi:hypothetical protein
MLEAAFTAKLLKALRTHPGLIRDAVIWKHADPYSKGIPDFSISIGQKTIWFEVKVWPNRPTKLQSYYLSRLKAGGKLIMALSSGGKVIIAFSSGRFVGFNGYWHTFSGLVEEIVRLMTSDERS